MRTVGSPAPGASPPPEAARGSSRYQPSGHSFMRASSRRSCAWRGSGRRRAPPPAVTLSHPSAPASPPRSHSATGPRPIGPSHADIQKPGTPLRPARPSGAGGGGSGVGGVGDLLGWEVFHGGGRGFLGALAAEAG